MLQIRIVSDNLLLRKQNKTLFVITKTEQNWFSGMGPELCSQTINYDHRGNSEGGFSSISGMVHPG
jgi:hypothetical protein